MERITKKKTYREYKIELELPEAERLMRFCVESDMKYTSVFRRSLRLFLNSEEQKISNERLTNPIK